MSSGGIAALGRFHAGTASPRSREPVTSEKPEGSQARRITTTSRESSYISSMALESECASSAGASARRGLCDVMVRSPRDFRATILADSASRHARYARISCSGKTAVLHVLANKVCGSEDSVATNPRDGWIFSRCVRFLGGLGLAGQAVDQQARCGAGWQAHNTLRCEKAMTRLIKVALSALLFALAATGASAETLLMPERSFAAGQSEVVWGITSLPNGTAFTIDYGDGSTSTGPDCGAGDTVLDRSYIACPHTYALAGPYTVTLTVGAESATVTVQVYNTA